MLTEQRPSFSRDGEWMLIGPAIVSARTLKARLPAILLSSGREVFTHEGWGLFGPG
jgi:hypothetical protein